MGRQVSEFHARVDPSMTNSRPDSLHYEERLVAFIDVLGFADLVLASGDNTQALEKVGKLAATNKLFDAFFAKLMDRAKTAFFSDSFVISMDPTEIIYLVREIGFLARYLILLGLPCRGAISCGALHHEGRIVVGPALVRAYKMEKSAAKYPRVILDAAAMECWRAEFAAEPAHADCVTLVKTDQEGMSYLDLFNPGWAANFIPWTEFIPSPDAIPSDEAKYLNIARDRIEQGRAAASDDKTRAKYEWLAAECPLSD
jgi:hypothetical protein